jgi:hypothetical protein
MSAIGKRGGKKSGQNRLTSLAAGVTNRLFDVSDLVALLIENEKKAA